MVRINQPAVVWQPVVVQQPAVVRQPAVVLQPAGIQQHDVVKISEFWVTVVRKVNKAWEVLVRPLKPNWRWSVSRKEVIFRSNANSNNFENRLPWTSTSHALFTLRTTVEYFNKRGSDVLAAFLDCTKAFDRISHYGLFSKLMKRNVPLCLILIIICWHVGMTCRVKWGSEFSDSFPVPLGTKQGGVSSPKCFSLYVNDLVSELRKHGVGCHLIRLFVGCVLFADDLALLSPSRRALQKWLIFVHCTSLYMSKHCLQFNAKKSKVTLQCCHE